MDISEEMKRSVREKALSYIESEKTKAFKDEVESALEKEDWDDLYDRFYTSLAFGTAGMRGVIGGGTNRINTYMVRKVTQGLADYLKRIESPSCVIAYDSRNYSYEFAHSAALVLSANGVRTYLYDTLHPICKFCNLYIMRRRNLPAIGPVYLVTIVFAWIVACRNDNT